MNFYGRRAARGGAGSRGSATLYCCHYGSAGSGASSALWCTASLFSSPFILSASLFFSFFEAMLQQNKRWRQARAPHGGYFVWIPCGWWNNIDTFSLIESSIWVAALLLCGRDFSVYVEAVEYTSNCVIALSQGSQRHRDKSSRLWMLSCFPNTLTHKVLNYPPGLVLWRRQSHHMSELRKMIDLFNYNCVASAQKARCDSFRISTINLPFDYSQFCISSSATGLWGLSFQPVISSPNKALSAPFCLCIFLSSTCLQSYSERKETVSLLLLFRLQRELFLWNQPRNNQLREQETFALVKFSGRTFEQIKQKHSQIKRSYHFQSGCVEEKTRNGSCHTLSFSHSHTEMHQIKKQ